ncbi:MAG: hypothetical protein WDZ67_00785, partial [Patescibacteria group bacterium]
MWIVGIPIALGFLLKGQWPKTKGEFWATEIAPWLGGFFWPVGVILLLNILCLQGLWFAVVWTAKGLFRLGSWFRRWLLG